MVSKFYWKCMGTVCSKFTTIISWNFGLNILQHRSGLSSANWHGLSWYAISLHPGLQVIVTKRWGVPYRLQIAIKSMNFPCIYRLMPVYDTGKMVSRPFFFSFFPESSPAQIAPNKLEYKSAQIFSMITFNPMEPLRLRLCPLIHNELCNKLVDRWVKFLTLSTIWASTNGW